MDFENLSQRPEVRSVAFTDVDLSSDGNVFRGYAAVFDEVADLGAFTESISRGAFRKALSNGTNVPMYWNHNDQLPPVATTQGGTLRLKEDGKGLLVEADIARHFVGDAVREMVQRDDVKGMSFGFVAGKGNSRLEGASAKPHRNLTGFQKLLDVSPTHDPAYAGTNASFRSLVRALEIVESLDSEQPILSGAYQQLEDGAPVETADTGDDETRDVPEVDPGTTMCDDCGLQIVDGQEHVCASAPVDEQRAGAEPDSSFDEAAHAARTRRLQMLGLTLPR